MVFLRRTIARITPDAFQSRWLNKAALARLKVAIDQAEKGHRGEIRLVIEKSLPFHLPWNISIRQRAEDLFAHLRVWDTKERSGVLLYLNLSEHRLEIVTDRGVQEKTDTESWQAIADKTVAMLYDKQRIEALETLILDTGALLRAHYPEGNPYGNELSDDIELR